MISNASYIFKTSSKHVIVCQDKWGGLECTRGGEAWGRGAGGSSNDCGERGCREEEGQENTHDRVLQQFLWGPTCNGERVCGPCDCTCSQAPTCFSTWLHPNPSVFFFNSHASFFRFFNFFFLGGVQKEPHTLSLHVNSTLPCLLSHFTLLSLLSSVSWLGCQTSFRFCVSCFENEKLSQVLRLDDMFWLCRIQIKHLSCVYKLNVCENFFIKYNVWIL